MAYKPKFKYRVTMTTMQFDDGVEYSRTSEDMGITWATSAAKAISNIKFREGIRDNNGGYGNYGIRQKFYAELI